MKFLKMGDWHLGVKQDDPWIQGIQWDGIQQAINYSLEHGIKRWLQAGDVFDVRKAITHKTMQFTRQIFNAIEDAGIKLDIVVGNHDMTFKEKIHPNACTELLTQFKNVTIHDKFNTITIDGIEIDMIPWICSENAVDILANIGKTKSKYCMGHFELNGFYFYKGLKSRGVEPDFLKGYKRVWSGHFHTISESNNVTYIGTPWTLTAGDENDKRGFWVFDTETEESEFIANETMWHRRIHYPSSINPEMYRNLSVRVVINSIDKDLVKFETALENVVHELKMINKVDHLVEFNDVEDEIEIKTLNEMMDEYVDALDIKSEDAESIKKMANELYLEVSK